ncbi:MAG: hypothetical protein P1U68_11075 [Verrucomicrobiales bacterium]|nr:hypothetical protein [Verrucomicrobiales bacterium]
MKNTLLYTLLAFVLSGQIQAQVKETPATLGLAGGANPQGYVQNSNDKGVFFATNPGSAGRLIPYSDIRGDGLDKLIRFDERASALADARALFSKGDYTEAASAFGEVAREYGIILSVPQNFASEALFYQAECLRRSGRFALLAKVVNSPAAKTINTKLGETYRKDFEFMKLWGLLGEGDFEGLKSALASYEAPVTGDAKLLATPNFVKMPLAHLAQLSFLRAKVFDEAGEKSKALDDYYRVFTLAYGNDLILSKLAMGQSMLILSNDPNLEKANGKVAAEMQSLAYLFGLRFGRDSMPDQFRQYAVRPAMSVPKGQPAAE